MKQLVSTVIAATPAFTVFVFADDAQHPEKVREAKGRPMMEGGMMCGARPGGSAGCHRQMERHMGMMQMTMEHMMRRQDGLPPLKE